MSFRAPRPTSNPYLPLLWDGLSHTRGIEPLHFSWREALVGRWDVLHVQWPETLLAGRTWLRRRVNELRYALLLGRVRLTGRGLVRTAHNVATHTPATGIGRRLALLTDRWAGEVIRLNETTPVRAGAGVTTVPHGHYRDWYTVPADVARVPRRLLFFGLIRPYKGIEELLDALAADPEADLELRIVGAPADPALAERIEAAARTDPRVACLLRHLDDDELAAEITAAAVVVLPYRELHNSGALLLALSLDRPVLVPAGEVTDALAAEVGQEWVRRFGAESATGAEAGSAAEPGTGTVLTAPSRTTRSVRVDDLAAALVAADQVTGRPDLGGRDWAEAAEVHAEVYRRAAGRPTYTGRHAR